MLVDDDFERRGIFREELGDVLGSDVGDDVPELVHFQGDAFDESLVHSLRLGRGELGIVRDRVAEFFGRDAFRKPARHGSKNVPAVEGLADRVEKIVLGGDVPNFHAFFALEDERQHAVVRRDEDVFRGARQDRAAGRAHAGIDYDHVNRLGREIAVTLPQRERRVENVVRADLVAQVNNQRFRIDAQDDAFHDPHKVVREAEIGGQSHYGPARQCSPWSES